jgi:hypothetical protein
VSTRAEVKLAALKGRVRGDDMEETFSIAKE